MLISCKSFKDYSSQKVALKKSHSQKFILDNNQMITNLTINHKEGFFLFDTGAMSSIITDSLYLNSFKLCDENFTSSLKLKSATGSTIESFKFKADTIFSDIFTGSKKLFNFIKVKSENINCSKKDNSNVGIIGYDFLKNAGTPILLDFENLQIVVLGDNYNTSGFNKLNTKISKLGSKLTIPLLLDGYKTDFLFDTGNNGGLLLKEKSNKISDTKLVLTAKAILGAVDGFSYQEIKSYKDVRVNLKEIPEINTKLSVLKKLTINTMGISFIKHFNWILDFNSGDVYAKQITHFTKEEPIKQNLKLMALANNNILIVALKDLSCTIPYNVGDQITSVNNTKVTLENTCEMQDLLNKTQDWNTLQLEVVPVER